MMHAFDPASPIMAQLRAIGLPEHLPVHQAMVYRFFDEGRRLLYVGVTVSPRGRWQAHKKSADWWTTVAYVSFRLYPHERAALDDEVQAIHSEGPAFNRRSAPTPLMQDSCAAHESCTRYSSVVLPRVGGGVGGGVRGGSIGHPCIKSHQGEPRRMGGRSAAEIGGV